jgi:hypothetical protein
MRCAGKKNKSALECRIRHVTARDMSMAKIMSCSKQLSAHLLPNFQHWEAIGRLRQAAALPAYTVALLLDFVSEALGRLAAWIASDDWR